VVDQAQRDLAAVHRVANGAVALEGLGFLGGERGQPLPAPPARLAEFFGLWGLAVKAASIVGPLTYGAVTWLFAGNHRLAIFSTGLYFVVGLALLAGIDVERGRRQALAA
jgi:hypothetical protein